MKTLIKSLFVWLLLLAVPFQGFASATMFLCMPMSAPMPATPAAKAAGDHRHTVLMASETTGQHCAGSSHPGADTDTKAAPHADHKCNSCANCCVGAALTSSPAADLQLEAGIVLTIPFDLGAMPVVDLAFPERPPQVEAS